MVRVTNWAVLSMLVGSLVGCSLPGMAPVGLKPVMVSPVSGLKGSVTLRVSGLVKRAYQVLAATDAIERLNITLSAGDKVYERSLSRKALSQPEATVNFEAVPVGVAVLDVQALDVAERIIGKGSQKTDVIANEVVMVPVAVKMAGNTGGVSATITFEEDEQASPHKALPWNDEGFRVADDNDDKYLGYAEFERHFPFDGMSASAPRPLCRLPVRPVQDETGGPQRGVLGARAISDERCLPAVGGARQTFERLDRNFDGFLTLEEFTGQVVEVQPQPTNVPLIQDCSMDFKARDRDGDGLLSLTEWLGIPEGAAGLTFEKAESYARLDVDKDGFLSLEEFRADCQDVRPLVIPTPL